LAYYADVNAVLYNMVDLMISNYYIWTAAFTVLLQICFVCFGIHSRGHNNQSLHRTSFCEFSENSAKKN
jgi:hypothetical protein